ncbi:MAG: hypothetical protein QOJ06_3248 [Pseudonocardiales bacterium]|nr:hypothetical protein [Pseudonocardiales bacterium]
MASLAAAVASVSLALTAAPAHADPVVVSSGRPVARCFFARAMATIKVVPVEVTTDKAVVYPHVLDELAPGAWHCTELYANNRMEADHGQLKRRLRRNSTARDHVTITLSQPTRSSPDL